MSKGMLKRISCFIDRIFHLEQINGRELCPTYLYRWTLLSFKNLKVYLHHFVGDDWSRDLHDHPKRFISIGLKGSYWEETPDRRLGHEGLSEFTEYKAPWIRTFPATHIHRLRATDCWTLVIVLKQVRSWGFWYEGFWIPWREYVGGALADRRKNCVEDLKP